MSGGDNWQNASLRWLTSISAGGTPSRKEPDYWGGDIPWIGSGEVNQRLIEKPTEYITEQGLEDSSTRLFPENTVVVALAGQGKTKGTAGILTREFACNQSVAGIQCQKSALNPHFLLYRLEADYKRLRGLAGESRDGLNLENLNSWEIKYPDKELQRKIVSWLNNKVSDINELISFCKKLKRLINEKLTAEMTNAVLTGIGEDSKENSNTKIEWLGEIPKRWTMTQIRFVTSRVTYGFTNPMPTTSQGPYMLTANDVQDGRIDFENARRTSEEAYEERLTDKCRPQRGDVLVTKDGTLGRVAVFPDEFACINQSVAFLRPQVGEILPAFLAGVLRSKAYQDRMKFEAGGTTIKHIYISRLKKMPIAVPSLAEQKRIVEQMGDLEDKCTNINYLIEDMIDNLKEKKKSIIRQAVTGQIDLTEWKPVDKQEPIL